MPSRLALSQRVLRWRCPQCSSRSLSSSSIRQAVGPDHPRYIEVPEPPQPSKPEWTPVKGVLPVPRDVLAGRKGKHATDEKSLAKTITPPTRKTRPKEGSRERWKTLLSESRRRNLREGLASLQMRKESEERRARARDAQMAADRLERVTRPMREDERLTAPSHGLDLQKLLRGNLEDETRHLRLEAGRSNVAAHIEAKKAERLDSLHNLYMHARQFIVTPEQLDAAVDEAFGTPDKPVVFGDYSGMYSEGGSTASVWAYGKPLGIQDMLNQANGTGVRGALDGLGGQAASNLERVRRIAEGLTGGKMDSETSSS